MSDEIIVYVLIVLLGSVIGAILAATWTARDRCPFCTGFWSLFTGGRHG